MSKEKRYEKILCFIEFIISIIFITIGYLVCPMSVFVIVIGVVFFIKFIIDFIKMSINN